MIVKPRIGAGACLFLVAWAAAAPAEERLAFVGDSGTGDSAQLAVRNQLVRFEHSRVFFLGDNVYSRGERQKFGLAFDQPYAPLLNKGVALHAALGNHDVKECSASLVNPLPPNADAYSSILPRCDVEHHLAHPAFGYVAGRRYYSVPSRVTVPGETPLAEVFVLDSNTLRGSQSKLLLREDTAQLAWLEAALAASTARWKIVVMHHPPHSPAVPATYFFFVPVGSGRAREAQLERQLTPILVKHGVDAVITGHNHFYARMLPQAGIRYFVSGGGGRKVYGFEPEPGYVLAGGGFNHFLQVRLTPERFEYYAIDSVGALRDSGWFAKGDARDRPLALRGVPP